MCLKFSVTFLEEICEAELSTKVMPVLARRFHAKGGVREGEAEEKSPPSLPPSPAPSPAQAARGERHGRRLAAGQRGSLTGPSGRALPARGCPRHNQEGKQLPVNFIDELL